MAQVSQNTTMAVLAYILFFVPLLTGEAKKDEFIMFHTKQGLVLFILGLVINIVQRMLPYSFYWLFNPIFSLLSLGVVVLLVIGIINVVNGKKEPLPVVGGLANLFKF